MHQEGHQHSVTPAASRQDEAKKLALGALCDADHLADCAERLLAAANQVAGIEARIDVSHGEALKSAKEALELAEALRSELWTSVRGAIAEYRVRASQARDALVAAEESALEWRGEPPTVEELNGSGEEFFWVRGGNFNRSILVRASNGVNSVLEKGCRKFRPELNFTFQADNYPSRIWASELLLWPGLSLLEWAGPIPRVALDQKSPCLASKPRQ